VQGGGNLAGSTIARRHKNNWLPAPKGPFLLMLRLYWPTDVAPTIIDGSWKLPGVSKFQ
jgi:hypothetical protein